MHSRSLTIKEIHLDTFGHVNNATYLQLFEDARWDWITNGGYGLAKIRSSGKGPVILDITIRFKRELKQRDEVVIKTELISYEGKIGKILQQMVFADGSVACEAEFTIAFFDLQSRKIIPPTEEWLKALQ